MYKLSKVRLLERSHDAKVLLRPSNVDKKGLLDKSILEILVLLQFKEFKNIFPVTFISDNDGLSITFKFDRNIF